MTKLTARMLGRPLSTISRHACGAAVVAAVSGFDWLAFGPGRSTDVVLTYLLGVVVVAMCLGYGPSLLASAVSVMAYDFFFVPPYFRFNWSERHDALTFAIMLLVAVVIGNLTERIRHQAELARQREARIGKLYAMSRELAVSGSRDAVAGAATRHVRDVFDAEVSVLLPDAEGRLAACGVAECDHRPDAKDMATAQWVRVFAEHAGLGSETLASSAVRFVPLVAPAGTVGVLAVSPRDGRHFDGVAARELLDAFANQMALALERGQLAEQAQRAAVQVQTEQLRNALLSSVSHDLRTPLAVVQGAATALLERGDALPPDRRTEYVQTISHEASRLNRLVRNLLDMTALQAGVLRARKEWQPIDEVIGVALERLEESLRDRAVETDIPSDLPLVPIDATLMEQVLINLLENAIKYSPPRSPITITARGTPGGVELVVADRGPGIPAGEEERIFDKFHRAVRHGQGMGLGLTICRGIVTAHDGTIAAELRPGGGALLRFTLPIHIHGEIDTASLPPPEAAAPAPFT